MRPQPIGYDCLTCPVRGEQSFCDLSLRALEDLNKVKCRTSYPAGAKLFDEGQPPRGVFVLCAGTAKLSTSSSSGRTIITRIGRSGEVLGLNAAISGRCYSVSAEMMESGQANFIARDSLLHLMRDHNDVAVGVGEQLSAVYYTAHEEVRTLGLTTDPAQRLAKLLLAWTTSARQNDGGDDSLPVTLALNHEEIGQTIGVTRQTVTRLLSEFRKREMLQFRKSVLCIQDRPALEKISGPMFEQFFTSNRLRV
jgi:CRP/FNR family transcriptional regulator, cyclic AMP receptor protein